MLFMLGIPLFYLLKPFISGQMFANLVRVTAMEEACLTNLWIAIYGLAYVSTSNNIIYRSMLLQFPDSG